jgi:hypothetical protein
MTCVIRETPNTGKMRIFAKARQLFSRDPGLQRMVLET